MNRDPFSTPSSLCLVVAAALLCSSALLGCRPAVDEHGERPLDTVEVDAGATSGISFEEDQKASRSHLRGDSQLAGVLPGGFPKDLPLPLPASVLAYGDRDDRWVQLSVPRSLNELRIFVERRWPSAGWTAVEGGFQSGDRRVEAALEAGEAEGESRLRIAYR